MPSCNLKLQPTPYIIEGHDVTIDDLCIYRDRLATTKNIEMVTVRATNVTLVKPMIFGSKDYAQGFRNRSEGEHGVGLHGAQNITIIEPTVHNVCGDFIYCGPRGRTPCRNITIVSPDFFNSGRHGIAALAVDTLDCTAPGRIHGYRRTGVDLERQFGDRSLHRNVNVDRTMLASWRKLRRQGDV